MRIAFLHYHLRPGGVTSVIKSQISTINDVCETVALTSQPPDRDIGTEIITVPLLAYESELGGKSDAEELADSIEEAVGKKWPGGCDILHVHNPTLGKNRKLTGALNILNRRGYHLFLQIHDFAEDGRPHIYSEEEYVHNAHYGVINSRDYKILRKAGLKKEGVHLLENKVTPFNIDSLSNNGLILYPVRAIRRKNIGEAILLSLFLDKDQTIGITLPPNSPDDYNIYKEWKKFIKTQNINVRLDVALKTNFIELVRNAKYMITTSINEGFGFTFLEPWTASKMVFGRSLPHVCNDFANKGVKMDHLYSSFDIPIECFDVNGFFKEWEKMVLLYANGFNHRISKKKIENGFEWIIKNDRIDFKYLSEDFQSEAILKIMSSQRLKNKTLEYNPWIAKLQNFTPDPEIIEHNNRIVRNYYGDRDYKKRLLRIYEKVRDVAVEQRIDKKVVLKEFFDLKNFSMLRWKNGSNG